MQSPRCGVRSLEVESGVFRSWMLRGGCEGDQDDKVSVVRSWDRRSGVQGVDEDDKGSFGETKPEVRARELEGVRTKS